MASAPDDLNCIIGILELAQSDHLNCIIDEMLVEGNRIRPFKRCHLNYRYCKASERDRSSSPSRAALCVLWGSTLAVRRRGRGATDVLPRIARYDISSVILYHHNAIRRG